MRSAWAQESSKVVAVREVAAGSSVPWHSLLSFRAGRCGAVLLEKTQAGMSPQEALIVCGPDYAAPPFLIFLATRPLPSENCICSLWSFLPQPLPTFTSKSVSSYFPKVPLKSTLSPAQIGRDRKKTCFSSAIELQLLQRLSLNLCPSTRVRSGFSGSLQG